MQFLFRLEDNLRDTEPWVKEQACVFRFIYVMVLGLSLINRKYVKMFMNMCSKL